LQRLHDIVTGILLVQNLHSAQQLAPSSSRPFPSKGDYG
jgi:hypothetical protein